VRATEFEFRNRFWLILLTYFVGFGSYSFDHLNAVEALAHGIYGTRDAHLDYLAARHAVQGMFAFSATLITAAAWIRTWASAYLRSEVVHDSALHTDRLVADGPYRHLSNPLYLGNLLLAGGLSMLASRTGAVVLMLGNLLIVLRLIGREEAAMMQSQGEAYRAFRAAVPRLWPSLRPRLPADDLQPKWLQAFLGEAWMWAFALNGWLFARKLNGQLYNLILGISAAAYFLMRFVEGRLRQRKLQLPAQDRQSQQPRP
jgi:protein-S-isoprenylcysteine O-methyltransferase Ste14